MAVSRVALVTGAGSGIGRAVSLALAERGYGLVLAGRRADALEESAALAEAAGGRALAVPTDVADPEAVRALFDAAVAHFGRVDLLFNNAGSFGDPAPLDQLTDAQWRAVIDANLSGSFFCAREAFRAMKAQRPQGGRIVNNGSISAHVPRPHAVAYTASKHAITGLTKSIALEGRAYSIAGGQIDIGNAATELTSGISQGALQPDGSRLAEPTMDVQNVAQAVLYMAGLPLDANVLFMTVMATKMPYVGRG